LAPDEVALPAEAGADEGQPGILVRVLGELAPGGGEAGVATAEVREIYRERRLDGRLIWHGDPRIAGRPIVEFATRVTSQETGRQRIGLGVRGRVAIWIDGQLAHEDGEVPDTDDIDGMWHDPPYQAVELDMTAGRPVEVVMRWRKFYDQGIVLIDMSIEKPVVSPRRLWPRPRSWRARPTQSCSWSEQPVSMRARATIAPRSRSSPSKICS